MLMHELQKKNLNSTSSFEHKTSSSVGAKKCRNETSCSDI